MIVREWGQSARLHTNRHESFSEEGPGSHRMSVSYPGFPDQVGTTRFENKGGRSEVFQPGGDIFQRQEAFDLNIRLSTEPVMEQALPSYRTISEEADRLLKRMEEKRNSKWFTSIKPIGYVAGSLYSARQRAPVVQEERIKQEPQVMPSKPLLRVSDIESFSSTTDKAKISPRIMELPKALSARPKNIGRIDKRTNVRLTTASEMIYPDGHSSPTKTSRPAYGQQRVDY